MVLNKGTLNMQLYSCILPSPWLLIGMMSLVFLSSCATSPQPKEISIILDIPSRMELYKFPFYPQQDQQCSPATLAMSLRYSGLDVTPEQLSPMVYTPGRNGSMPQDMIGAARRHNRLAYPLNTLKSILQELAAGHPVIVLQKLGLSGFSSWHYALVIGYDLENKYMILRSGVKFRTIMSFKKFQQVWKPGGNWAIITLLPDELPSSYEKQKYHKAMLGLKRVHP